MIVVRLAGGLGNQMFQYALGISLASKLNTEVVLDLNTLLDHSSKNPNAVHRFFDLDIFKTDGIKFLSKNESNFYSLVQKKSRIGRLVGRIIHLISGKRAVYELGRGFNQRVLSSKNNSCLVGAWQSYKYFDSRRALILKAFRIESEALKEANYLNYERKINDSEVSVSVQVRRGDYVSNSYYNDLLGVQSIHYFENAMTELLDQNKNAHFFIFSDDIDWCKENFKKTFQITFVDQVRKKSGMAADLKLMSICDHNIISNSSFAWWGAWLNENPDKIVIAPKHWVNPNYENDPSVNPKDILPMEWIKL